MSSPCNVSRLVRCRVRDLASCFYAYRLPLEEEPDSCSGKPSQTWKETMAFDSKVAGKYNDKERRKKPNIAKKISKEDGEEILSVENPSSQNRGKCGARVAEDSIRAEPRFAEEDYIVFCFREDGAIHMINEGKSSEKKYEYHENNEPSKPTTTTTTDDTTPLRPISNKVDDKGCQKIEKEWPLDDGKKEIKSSVNNEQPNASKMDSFESCDSNLSDDTSTSSFAFPVLGIEWIGSPVHMPKSEKQEGPTVRLHCCRF